MTEQTDAQRRFVNGATVLTGCMLLALIGVIVFKLIMWILGL